jgi:ketosteroid isomerase-like protein
VSLSNIELLAQAFAGWGKNDPANMRNVLHPECELLVPPSVPYGGTFTGPDEVIGWFTRELWCWFDDFTSTPEGFVDGGDTIVVPVHVQARAKNGKVMDVHNVWIYEFSDGKLIRGRVYADTSVLRDTVAGSRRDDRERPNLLQHAQGVPAVPFLDELPVAEAADADAGGAALSAAGRNAHELGVMGAAGRIAGGDEVAVGELVLDRHSQAERGAVGLDHLLDAVHAADLIGRAGIVENHELRLRRDRHLAEPVADPRRQH